MPRGHLSWGSFILGGNCPGTIIWGQFSQVGILRGGIVRGAIAWGAIFLGGDCLGGNYPVGNCPVPKYLSLYLCRCKSVIATKLCRPTSYKSGDYTRICKCSFHRCKQRLRYDKWPSDSNKSPSKPPLFNIYFDYFLKDADICNLSGNPSKRYCEASRRRLGDIIHIKFWKQYI